MKDFKIIAITSPCQVNNEAEKIVHALESGAVDFVHLRKPDCDISLMRSLITNIPEHLHPRLKLHDCFELLDEYNLGGVHLNGRNPDAPISAKSISKSMHTAEELALAGRFDYVTLSPIFSSISKPGYDSSIDLIDVMRKSGAQNVIAMGGVTPERFASLKNDGFAGVALLGWLCWDNDEMFNNRIKKLCCSI